ncbi:MAG: hypothetical protein JWM89_3299 [Acidimicrobiales bacterium]|nr:hypothetical protein [Acidimicrobiales bacterium]
MPRSSSMRVLVASIGLVALLVAGCGVKADDSVDTATPGPDSAQPTTTDSTGSGTTDTTDATTSTDGGSTDTTLGSGIPDIHDSLVQGFIAVGLTKKQAECLAKGYEDLGLTDPSDSGNFDYTKIQGLMSKCHVSFSDLAGGLPGGD